MHDENDNTTREDEVQDGQQLIPESIQVLRALQETTKGMGPATRRRKIMTLRGWAAGRRGTRLRCDYCRRIIVKDSAKSVPCSACGHGHLREIKPKNWCSICGEPQYDNVDPKAKVECDKCFGLKVDGIRQLETLLKTQFINTVDAKRKCERYALNNGKRVDGDLRAARKARGWNQTELAIHLGISRQAVQQMEIGKRPYGEKAKEWLESWSENV